MSPTASIAAERQADLNSGRDESRTLAEILAITHSALLTQVVPDAPEDLVEAAKYADSLGVLARMQIMGEALYMHLGRSACLDLADHPADTVRGWAVFALVSQEKDADVETLLALARPAADDPHFGVREWSWMAVRPHLVPQLDEAIRALRQWSSEPSERIRRFTSEVLRPHGVWARHIPVLKKEPERGLPYLNHCVLTPPATCRIQWRTGSTTPPRHSPPGPLSSAGDGRRSHPPQPLNGLSSEHCARSGGDLLAGQMVVSPGQVCPPNSHT
ncbi:hypothetical protein HMPREF0975_02588 [Actinomyces sp. oral taxon 849 str. F0330]|nr:hypothetical protein HMPREF0975_02588 [Actinomyces sp. oral taxon 849 str. F0330]